MASPLWQAYQTTKPIGIDLKRSVIGKNIGTYVVNASTTFRAGMLVCLNTSQEVVVSDGSLPVLGFAKYDKCTALYQTVVDERIQLTGTTATNLAHSNLFVVSAGVGVRVASGTQGSGTIYSGGGADYTLNETNGTITRNGGGTIVSGSYVYVTYIYQIPVSEMQFEGKNFFNTLDYTEYNDSRMTVITDQSIVFTTAYDPRQLYAVNSIVEAGAVGDGLAGYVTLTGVGAGANIGRVFQVPSASDPFMGIRFTGITNAL